MCGIYATNIPFSKEEVIKKLETIQFRGPDNTGYELIDNVTLGHLRLSILDLDKRSSQPFIFNEYRIVFNGEIYNYREIKSELEKKGYDFQTTSDTEVLIKGYYEWGKDILHRLNGMFAFAIYNSIDKTIFCARDRLGVKPFFYYWNNGSFEICSQLRPLINKERKLSIKAVSIYLDCGYVPSPYTILEDVFKLSPGCFMDIDLKAGTKTIEKYWNLRPSTVNDISYEEAKEQLHGLLLDAVSIRLQSDVSLGTFLSGGIDSALVASLASRLSKNKINTFTIGFENPQYDESKIARQYAMLIGSNHTEIICTPTDALRMIPMLTKVYDEPFADSSALPSLLLNSVTKQHVTVALSGDGGDESFLGYLHFDLLSKFNRIKKIPFIIRNMLRHVNWYKFFPSRPETIKGILSSRDSNDLIWKVFMGFDTLQKQKVIWDDYDFYKKSSPSPIQRMADLNIKLWLENDSNVKVDRASMAYSVESRSPFLDYRIVEFARSLPVEFRYQSGNKKRILKDILVEYIPRSVFEQPKRGFAVPLADWTRNDLKEDILFRLKDDFFNKIPNLDIGKFKRKLNDHLSNKYDYSFTVWKLYVLSLWFDEFKI